MAQSTAKVTALPLSTSPASNKKSDKSELSVFNGEYEKQQKEMENAVLASAQQKEKEKEKEDNAATVAQSTAKVTALPLSTSPTLNKKSDKSELSVFNGEYEKQQKEMENAALASAQQKEKEKEKEDNAATAAQSSAKVVALPLSTSTTSNNKSDKSELSFFIGEYEKQQKEMQNTAPASAQQKEKEKEDNAATAAELSAKVAALPPSTSMMSNNKCAWSVFRDCNPFLLAPIPCNVDDCTSTVHNICQVIWENKNKYDEQGTCTTTYCPEHHPAAPNIKQY